MKSKITIEFNNNKCKLIGDIRILDKIYKAFSIRHPNAYHIAKYMPRGWDRKVHLVTDRGYFKTGLLSKVYNYIKSNFKVDVEIVDNRIIKETSKSIILEFGDIKLRDYQEEAVKRVIKNKIDSFPFHRGILDDAVNAGKTLIMTAIYLSFDSAKGLILLDNSDLFNQFKDELPKYLPGVELSFMRGTKGDIKFGDLTIAMVQTLGKNIKLFERDLAMVRTLLVDECHKAGSKTFKKVLEKAFNATVRIGLSGSPFESKDKLRNFSIEENFGDILHKISEVELQKKGHSSKLMIKIIKGNTKYFGKNYPDEYKNAISLSEERNNKSIERMEYYKNRGKLPQLIVCKFHDHVEFLYQKTKKAFPDLKVEAVHHKVKNRKQIIKDFKEGKIDILIASLIIKIGQNMPLIKYLQNASGTDSAIDIIQISGRAQRKHESKKITYIDDFYDEGEYLMRHSKHRINYYKKRGFKVYNLVKKVAK